MEDDSGTRPHGWRLSQLLAHFRNLALFPPSGTRLGWNIGAIMHMNICNNVPRQW